MGTITGRIVKLLTLPNAVARQAVYSGMVGLPITTTSLPVTLSSGVKCTSPPVVGCLSHKGDLGIQLQITINIGVSYHNKPHPGIDIKTAIGW